MKKFLKNYWFILSMLLGIVAGCITGAFWPQIKDVEGTVIDAGATVLEPLGSLFINLMFCVVVPMVFCSIASAIANISSAKKAGKLMSTTIITFAVTAGIAAIVMFGVTKLLPGDFFSSQKDDPPAKEAKNQTAIVLNDTEYTFEVTGAELNITETAVEKPIDVGEMVVGTLTKADFPELISRKAMLPLIIFAVLFGFGVQMAGEKGKGVAKGLANITDCILNVVKIISYYAPIAFFGFFASLVAVYGPDLIGTYSKTLLLYYGMCFAYVLVFFPLYARFGGGKHGIREMIRHIFKPAAVSFGTCSSVATIPTNMEVSEDTGIPKEVSDVVIPLGATMHMDGSSMSAIIKVAFLFGLFGMPFNTGNAILAIIVAIFSSVAMSGIPGGGGVGELVLCTLFFPNSMEVAYPIAIALGNLVDPPATMVNAAGDYVVSYIVCRFTQGKDWLDKAIATRKEKKAQAQ